jgi:hypothetical protein
MFSSRVFHSFLVRNVILSGFEVVIGLSKVC